MAYLTDDEIYTYFKQLNPNFSLTDIPTTTRTFAWQFIDNETGRHWEIESKTVYLDGRNTSGIYLQDVPITTLCEVVIISPDTTEESLDFSRTSGSRVLEYDEDTGKISFIGSITSSIEAAGEAAGYQDNVTRIFPEGVRNIRVRGIFGDVTDVSGLVKQLQLLVIQRQLSSINPSVYAGSDLVKERIGKYEYQLLGATASQSQRKSLDEYIEFLIECLPGFTSAGYESI
jgi:hypothetical protein